MTVNTKRCRGRPMSFKREDLVQSVMEKFHQKGYANVSLNEIAKENGLTRTSLYNCFESKEALFLECLDHYYQQSPEYQLLNSSADTSVVDAIYEMFDAICAHQGEANDVAGCLMTDCVNELVSNDPKLGPELIRRTEQRKTRYEALLKKAVKRGELGQNTDVQILAAMLYTFLCGLSTYAKLGKSQQEIQCLCNSFLKQIGLEKKA